MYKTMLRWSLLLLFCCSTISAFGQAADGNGPYYLSLKRELLYGGAGALSLGVGTYLQAQLDAPLRRELEITAYDQINAFDRLGSNYELGNSRKLSDYGLYAGVALPGLLILDKDTRGDFGKITLLYAETMMVAGGLTNITKAGFARPRPYVYGPDWVPGTELKSGDQAAFVSGHTSLSAAGSFFFARVFSDYHPDSKLKPYVWGLAATVPAVTGYLRIRAGRHYPTDVIVGYALGATVGYLVPKLHKKPILPKGMRINAGATGVQLDYRF
ncbi:phosphatase PAP2 family protein [Neolewinella persica]|uniref:phosphatase PAP2 family protein n=1 Tax=Neolewinella persica TaxID=70998 RepID=UPI00035CBB1A|nr:phosphatase PAP2 family protein [Neolewinella persica]